MAILIKREVFFSPLLITASTGFSSLSFASACISAPTCAASERSNRSIGAGVLELERRRRSQRDSIESLLPRAAAAAGPAAAAAAAAAALVALSPRAVALLCCACFPRITTHIDVTSGAAILAAQE